MCIDIQSRKVAIFRNLIKLQTDILIVLGKNIGKDTSFIRAQIAWFYRTELTEFIRNKKN